MSNAALLKSTNYRASLTITRVLIYTLLGVLTLLCVVPFYVMFVNATRTNNEIFSGLSLIPGSAAIENIQTLILGKIMDVAAGTRKEGIDVPQGFLNSAIIAVSATALSGYFSSLTAYGFALYQFRLKKLLWAVIMTVIMIPPTVGLIGYYKLVSGLNMLDTYWPLILPAIASPFAVFFLRQYFASALPISLVEAARMDGAKEMSIFHRIGLPMSMPGVATVSILSFLGTWNNYLSPLIVLGDKKLFTLPLLIQQLNTSLYNRDFGAMYMGISLSVIPILIMFAFFSRYLIDEIGAGSVKE
jgi:multiple sugar transport system permease protein